MKVRNLFITLFALFFVSCAPEPIRVVSVTLNTKALTMEVGATEQLRALVSPNDAANPGVIWFSDNSSIAKVSASGLVTAVFPGTARITAKTDDGGISDACVVTVEKIVTALKLDPEKSELYVGGEMNIVASTEPLDAKVNVLFSSNNPTVASVDASGHVKALSPGYATICATTDYLGRQATCVIHVREKVQSLEVLAPLGQINIGETLQLEAKVLPANLRGTKLSWTSSDEGIAVVDESGVVTPISRGTVTFTATVENGEDDRKSASCEIKILQPVTDFDVSLSSTSLIVDEEVAYTVITGPDNADDKSYKVDEDVKDVVQVKDGKIKALKAGKAVLTFYPNNPCPAGLKKELTVVVGDKVKDIILSEKEITLQLVVDSRKKLKVEVIPQGADDRIKWESADETVATVDDSGLVTALMGDKSTTITAISVQNPAIKKTCIIHVKPYGIEGIKLDKTSLKMIEGDTETLVATVYPKGTSLGTDITWSSDKPEVADVSKDGKVTAKKEGTAIIKAQSKDPSIYEECRVEVEPKIIKVTGVGLDRETLDLEYGKPITLTATVKPDNATDKTVTWSSSDTKIATVDQNGKVTWVSSGAATITVTTKDGNKEAKCRITAKPVPVTSVSLNKTSLTLGLNGTETLKATVKPDNATDKTVTWSSSDTKVATVDQNGKVKMLSSKGEATITVTTKDGDKTASCKVIAKLIPVEGVTLDQTSLTLEIGNSKTLTATITPSNASNKALTWESSNKSVATVDNTGKVTAIAEGNTTITVNTADGGFKATCSVTVPKPPVPVTAISLSTKSATLTFGQSHPVDVTVVPAEATDPSWECSSSDTAIATVSKAGNVATITAGSKAGTATITFKSVKYPSVTASCSVTVKAKIIEVSKITISPSSLTMYVGQTKTVTAKVEPANADNKNIKWAVPLGASIASVDQNGIVTGIKEGSTRVIAKAEDGSGIQDYIKVDVKINSVASVNLSESELVLKEGETFDLRATVTAQDPSAPVSNPTLKWESSKVNSATVDSSGRVTAKSAGETTITLTVTSADKKSQKATCKVKVLSSSTGNGGSEGIGYDDWNFD